MNHALRLLAACWLLVAGLLPAQDAIRDKFIQDFQKALEFNDEKAMDKALKTAPDKALDHYQALYVQQWGGDKKVMPTIDAIKASWARSFEDANVLDKVGRWVDAQTPNTYQTYQTMRNNLYKCYGELEEALKSGDRKRIDDLHDALRKVGDGFEKIGHKLDAAEAWVLVSVLLNQVKDKTLQDRKDALFGLQRYLEHRQAWEWTKDGSYIRNDQFARSEVKAIEAAQKDEDKRKGEGYDPNAKGIESLVLPGVAAVEHALEFAPLKDKDLEEVDYSIKGGPVPAFWWEAQLRGEAKEEKIAWFQRTQLFLVRLGAAKFGVSPNPNDKNLVFEVDAGAKPKVNQFFLDAEKKVPYAMAFWTGGEQERLFEVTVNLAPGAEVAPVFYRSAASWHAEIGGETVTLYDDNADGTPCCSEPSKGEFKVYTFGQPGGTVVPLLDSMRIGKGPRVPFSEFAQIGGKWWHLGPKAGGTALAVREFNPEYLKTGKVKLKWDGPKPTVPERLVLQGTGTLSTAFFDVAGGKEIEVPAGEYVVVFGRIVEGKGARTQLATIARGDFAPIKVEEGKTAELKMGAPFKLVFERGGSGDEVVIDGGKIVLHDRSGAVLADLHNMVLQPEVLAAKAEDGKGAKVFARFVKCDDPELLNKAAGKYTNMGRNVAGMPFPDGVRDGSLELKAKLPFADAKVGLSIKKHPLFGKVDSDWK